MLTCSYIYKTKLLIHQLSCSILLLHCFILQTLAQVQIPLKEAGIEVANRMVLSSPEFDKEFFVSILMQQSISFHLSQL